MILTDWHVHTNYCDGKDSPRDIVLAAIKKKVSLIGIVAHSDLSVLPDNDWCLKQERYKDFQQEIYSLRKEFVNDIAILCGVEQDYYSTAPTEGFDFVIGSVHVLLRDGHYLCIDESEESLVNIVNEYYDGSWQELYEDYYSTLSRIYTKTKCSIVGHFDLITKFNKDDKYFATKSPEYRKAWYSAAKVLVNTSVSFEINTGGVYRGYKNEPYPSLEIIRALYNTDEPRLITSSDAHCKEAICYGFEDFGKLFKSKLV